MMLLVATGSLEQRFIGSSKSFSRLEENAMSTNFGLAVEIQS
jgi:hypothetical protein